MILVGAAQRLAELRVVRAVASMSGAVAPHDRPSTREHKSTTKLMPVLFRSLLGTIAAGGLSVKPDAVGAASCYSLRGESEDLPQGAARELHRLVRAQVRGYQDGETHAGLLLERPRLGRHAHAHEPDVRAWRQQVAVALELHRSDAALDTQVMPQEHECRGVVTPEFLKRDVGSVLILERRSAQRVFGGAQVSRYLHKSDCTNVAALMQAI